MGTTVIEVRNLSKAFMLRHNRSPSLKSRVFGQFYKRYREVRERFLALDDVSLEVHAGETFGIIGRNGSGKSTLLSVIAGILQPTSGKVAISEGARIGALLELGVGFHPELTGKENVYLNASLHGLSRRAIDPMYDSIVDFSELGAFMDVALKNYSSGMTMRLAFAVVAHLNTEILLIDEVLAVGDADFQQKCMERIDAFREAGKTIVFVSHSPETILDLCQRVCVLDGGRVVTVSDPPSAISCYHDLLHAAHPDPGAAVAPSDEAAPPPTS